MMWPVAEFSPAMAECSSRKSQGFSLFAECCLSDFGLLDKPRLSTILNLRYGMIWKGVGFKDFRFPLRNLLEVQVKEVEWTYDMPNGNRKTTQGITAIVHLTFIKDII